MIGTKERLKDNLNTLEDLLAQYKKAFKGAPSREGIGTLEKYRAATISGTLELEKQAAEAVDKAIDAVLGTLALIPVTAEIAGLIVLLKTTASLAVDALTTVFKWADQAVLGNFLTELISNLQLLSSIQESAYANQELIPEGVSKDGGVDNLHVQFRLRAEALYGLVALITRAGVSTSSLTEYREKLVKYRLAEYIEHFILGEQWEFPLKPSVPVSMDTYWLYSMSSYGPYVDPASYFSQFGFKRPLALSALNPMPGSMLILAVTDSVFKENAKANFHNLFPITCVDSQSVQELVTPLKTTFREIDAKSIITTCIYRRPKASKKDDDWQLIDSKRATDVMELPELSPLDQIRVLVVLDKKLQEGIYPISLQLFRTDGTNISGPVYKDIVRRLDSFLLSSEKKWKGHLGCVFHPFYQLGTMTIPGTKPLAGSAASILGVGAYYLFGHLTNMTYSFEVEVGGKRSRQWVNLGAGDGKKSELDEYRVSVDVSRDREERRLLLASFLESRSEEFKYPMLFQGAYEEGVGPCYVRLGRKGDYWIPQGTAVFKNFDWKTEVEFIVISWATRPLTDDYRKVNLDWKELPVQMELVNYEGVPDRKGPAYTSKLRYIGAFHPGRISFEKDSADPGENLQPIVDLLRNNEAARKKFEPALDPQKFGSARDKADTYHIFAAYFRMFYYGFDGIKIWGIRPFARTVIEHPNYYRYGIINIATAADSGLAEPKILGALSGISRPEYEFHFQAPMSYTSLVPWAGSGVGGAKVKKWIEEGSAKIKAQETIVAE